MIYPLVSTIIPVYNGEEFIAEAIDSVLMQTYRPIEIIVVDDGSDDSSEEIVKSYPNVNYIYQKNLGNGAARNTGIQKSNGEFLAFLDQDDLWIPQKIESQLDFLIKHPSIGYVGCNMKNFIQPGCFPSKGLSDIYPTDEQAAYIPSALLIRRSVFEDVGYFNPEMTRANDTDWHFRAKDKGIQMANVDKLLVHRRIHQSNLSHNRGLESRAVKELLQAVRESVHRKQNQNYPED